MPEVKQEGDLALIVEKWMQALLDHPFRLNAATFRITAKLAFPQILDKSAGATLETSCAWCHFPINYAIVHSALAA
jgi:hypothetical protein